MDTAVIVSLGLILGCLVGLSWFAGSDAPYIPTRMEAIRKILRLAGAKKGRKFYELGSGDGRVVLEAAKMGAASVGIEQSWIRVLYSRWKARNLSNAHFIHGNIFSSLREATATRNDINSADIVYIYLLLKGVSRLEKKLKKELKKGAVVVTQTYHFPNWKPFKKVDLTKEMDFSKDIQGAGVFQLYRK